MYQLLHIVKYKIIGGIKLKLEPTMNNVIKNLASLVIFGGFALGAYFFSYNMTSYLIEDVRIGQFLLHRFLSMFLFVFFITISLGNILVSYSTLFKSPEVRFLFTQPVSYFKIFLIKFLDNFFYSSTTFFLMGFAVIVGYGAYFGHPWYFYPLMMFGVFIPFMLLAACIAVVILLVVLRFTEFMNIRYLAGLFILGYLSVVYVFFHSVSPLTLVNDVLEHFPEVDQYFTGFDPWFLKYLPSHWVAELLYWSVQGSTHDVVFNGGQLLLCVGAVFGGAMMVGRRMYYPAWLLTINIRERRSSSKRNIISGTVDMYAGSIVPRHISVLLKRDLIRFLRDPGQWIHFTLMLLLVTVFLISVSSIDAEFRDPFLMTVVYLVIFIFNAFLVAAIALRFVYPLMSLEGEALWTVRSAPFNMKWIYILKGIIAITILLVIAQVITYVTVISMYGKGDILLFSMVAQLLTVVTIVGINLGLGSYFAQYNEKNPIRIASSQGASLTFLIVLLYLIFIVSAFIPFLTGYFEHVLIFSGISMRWMIPPLVLSGAITLILASTASALGMRAVSREV
jgi:ABC-2 type transport system permease protein